MGLITLNDPERLNAMSEAMAGEFSQLVAQLSLADEIRVVVITGAGRAFSAGGDLDMLLAKNAISQEENRRQMLRFYEAFLCLRRLNLPVMAAVNGHAVGAGLCLAAACDLRLADPRARFSAPFTKLGLHPGMGASYFLPRALGPTAAADLMLTGRSIGADEALRLGLVSRVSEEGQVLELARQMVSRIESCAPIATTELLLVLRGEPTELQAALEQEAAAQARCYARDEFVEGVKAVRDNR